MRMLTDKIIQHIHSLIDCEEEYDLNFDIEHEGKLYCITGTVDVVCHGLVIETRYERDDQRELVIEYADVSVYLLEDDESKFQKEVSEQVNSFLKQ